MYYGMMTKIVREIFIMTILASVGLFAFHILLAIIAPAILSELSENFIKMAFVKTIIKGLFGEQAGQSLGTAAIAAFAWIHPIPLIVIWGHAVVYWARVPAGEIERGTIDILLSQPISRFQIAVCETSIFLLSGIVLVLVSVMGNTIGGLFVDTANRLEFKPLVMIACNLYCLYIIVGALSCMISSFCKSRAVALGASSMFIALAYLIHTLVPFWSTMKKISFLSILDYYEPLVILRAAVWPIHDMLILLGFSILLWSIGTYIFLNRNISTV